MDKTKPNKDVALPITDGNICMHTCGSVTFIKFFLFHTRSPGETLDDALRKIREYSGSANF